MHTIDGRLADLSTVGVRPGGQGVGDVVGSAFRAELSVRVDRPALSSDPMGRGALLFP
ncbi:hypothetical protein [Streptomyces cacaoi]|uniref:hypothetical protein n=1 Tax=Streptomyces cacaoi TaxID=1898 RepID=UPI00374782B3